MSKNKFSKSLDNFPHCTEQRKTAADLLATTYKDLEKMLPTKKTPQQRTEEIQDALRQVTGPQNLLKSGFSRSAVNFLEKDDVRRKHCERVVFSVNLSEQELQYPLEAKEAEEPALVDGRSLRRFCWDEAVNNLTETLTSVGIKPKYLRNDRNSCRINLRQEFLAPQEDMPDEYFSIDLYYCSEQELEIRKLNYVQAYAEMGLKIEALRQQLFSFWTSAGQKKKLAADVEVMERERALWKACTPDPREMDAGLVFHIDLMTSKDHGTTKEQMQTVLIRFITALSRVAGGHLKLVQSDTRREYAKKVA